MLDFSRDLHDIASLVGQDRELSDVLRRALLALQAVVPYDLAAIYRLEGERLRVIATAGALDSHEVRRHTLPLARFPTIRRALENRSPIALEAHHHASEEGDPYAGIVDLPDGHACMVVPLFAADQSLGLITLDRTQCQVYSPEAIHLAGVYGQLIGFAIRFAEQAALLDRYRAQLEANNRLLLTEAGGDDEACRRLEASLSPAMRQLVAQARQVGRSELPVLIQGETGTGKEVLAQALHAWSPRARHPFVKLNCAALPEGLLESELFGHVRGAFTGAARDRRGRFLTANGGSLLLDEIGDLPLAAQAKLLRVLQEGTFEPVGSDQAIKVDVRILAATHIDLREAVSRGRFREDLYYRLAVFPLHLPPLRQRQDDILAIAEDLLDQQSRAGRGGPWSLSPGARRALLAAPWPGNVRELRNVIERATILQPSGLIEETHLGLVASPRSTTHEPSGRPPSFEENERRYLRALLDHCGGRIYGPDGAAAIAGLPPSTLRSRMVKLGLR